MIWQKELIQPLEKVACRILYNGHKNPPIMGKVKNLHFYGAKMGKEQRFTVHEVLASKQWLRKINGTISSGRLISRGK